MPAAPSTPAPLFPATSRAAGLGTAMLSARNHIPRRRGGRVTICPMRCNGRRRAGGLRGRETRERPSKGSPTPHRPLFASRGSAWGGGRLGAGEHLSPGEGAAQALGPRVRAQLRRGVRRTLLAWRETHRGRPPSVRSLRHAAQLIVTN